MKVHLCRDEWWPMYDQVEEKYSDVTVEIDVADWLSYRKALALVRKYQNKFDAEYEAKETI